MADATGEARFVIDPPAGRRILAAYLGAMLAVAAVFAALVVMFGRSETNDVASDVASAVLVDLPPAVAAPAAPGSDAEAQTPAAAAATAPPPVEDKPKQEAEEKQASDVPLPVPPAPASSDLAAERGTPPPTSAAPPAAAQSAEAPSGSDASAPRPDAAADEGRPRASAHLVTIWQKALLGRLEAAKRHLGHGRRATGVVEIAFAIDRDGKLVSEEIRRTSGVDTLDRAALALVREAAPFPPSPAGVRDADLSFVVPIRFRR